ncbi:ferrochelatase [Pseudomarimonas salicorniae]|uniref:Ferrochelatase n=1 Tax=Pseudomarimonas salicorniae TaxID=2933270 RepID=A0ABT0GJM7_9GAMM|nr:ferrochelatase [Lysobacter sp. CAU 1642]MCK7594419.1 ferrochelatase [Lysobacter sp. CAU 1642]
MRYQGLEGYRHSEGERTGVLLVNLGTPDAPEPAALRSYLAEFLSDPRVIEVPRAIWLPILYGVILPFRSRRSAHAYAQVWSERGSPLRWHSEDLTAALQQQLDAAQPGIEVRLAMRYGQPSIRSVLDDWIRSGLRRLLVIPLYPQYSATTTATVFDEVSRCLARWRWPPELRWINDYFNEPGWAAAVAGRIREHWKTHGRGDRLLMSFHGIPSRYLRGGDPYHCQCHASARLIAAELELTADEWQLSFQSRVGREPWLQPYTDHTVEQLGREGIGRVDVVCPGFAVDCLETLEEIAMQNAEAFKAAGGGELRYIPALNSEPSHAGVLARLALRHLAGWVGESAPAPTDPAARKARFEAYRGPQR